MAYGEALALQRGLAQVPVLWAEPPPVVTLGRGGQAAHLVASKEFLAAKGVEVFEVERGGDVTCHGPGQLVGYPIYDLTQHRRDLHWFLRALEECLIASLREFGVSAERRAGFTGVWTAGRKIASIGIHVKQWVTWHGFALNVMTDLSLFDLIVPCGIPGVTMTSMQRELGERTPRDVWGRALDAVVLAFCEVFQQQAQMVELDAVRRET